MTKHDIAGGCHCGNVTYVFETTKPLDALGLRACQCTFCRAHGARTTSDPDGAFRLKVADASQLQRYRFGLKTADFLICKTCGAFIGALMEEQGRRYITVNANTFQPPPAYTIAGSANDFSAEDTSGRIARRAAKWTPVTEFTV
ncbi:MAG: aldehyde-activating protein [Alphaproteobacteria bacterium]|nr:aldehyde-activating protein [Alphaproteobacteria bacterium]MBV9903911.1 aldehyde-activating protein [Alphaproteobacteria bacterium]